MADPRVVIVGAGPAGVRAAETLVDAGLRPIVVDEGGRDGGQIYRRQPANFKRSYRALYGTEADSAVALHETFQRLRPRIDYLSDTLVWNLSEGEIFLLARGAWSALPFDAVIIATGATDRLMPVRGWHRAGVYSLGAAQIALKTQACSIGREVVFLGSGPLLYLVAAQYAAAGARIAAVLNTAPLGAQIAALPKLVSRPAILLKGLALLAKLKAAGVKSRRGVTPIEIQGDAEAGVSGVRVRLASGRELSITCDAVALGHHLRPETQLADLARCEFRFDAQTRQWVPIVDADGRSTVPGVYLAGDGARLHGADGAEAAGRLAALALLADNGRVVPTERLTRLRNETAVMERFRQGIAEAFPWPAHLAAQLDDETIVCRCEAITAGELRTVARTMGANEINRAKAFSRAGMGRCQGRYCGHAAAEVVAAAARLPLEGVGRLRAQAPVKPLAIAVRKDDA
jgi:NADPH-dependent 2,4-dienoyl-CoA reductase/sulfur reductase-like enzyme